MRYKNKLITILSIAFLSAASFYVLVRISDFYNHKQNSFVRLFPPHPVLYKNSLKLLNKSHYIAGASRTRIYLGNTRGIISIFSTTYDFVDTVTMNLTIEDGRKFTFKSIKVSIDSPYFYVMDGTIPAIFRGNILDWRATHYPSKAYFSQAVPMTEFEFVFNAIADKSHENILGRQVINDSSNANLRNDILEKQVDGLFCTDGMIRYDNVSGRIAYVYYYRNQYIVMDHNLDVILKGRTIDTIQFTKLSVTDLASNNSISISSPPVLVNYKACTFAGLLFIQSPMLAKNESKETFDKAAVIDVYEMNADRYRFSFYLFNPEGQKLRDFTVCNNSLIALYDNFLITYELRDEFFSSFHPGLPQ